MESNCTAGDSDDRSNDAENRIDPELWKHLDGRDLVAVLEQFMKRFGLLANDIASFARIERSTIRSAVHQGEFTPKHVTRLLVQVQKSQGIPHSEYHTWRKALYLAAFLSCQSHIDLDKRQCFWDTTVMKGLYRTVSQAYDATNGFAIGFRPTLADFAKAWEEEWGWIRVPKRYRVTRVQRNGYDLLSTLPLALEISKIHDLGPGLRVESKGWGTGAYRVYRISTELLGDPRHFEPELVHVPAGEFWMCKQAQAADGGTSHHVESTKVYLDEFWIGRYPVTVVQFAFFVEHYGYFTAEEEKFGSDWRTWRQPNPGEHRDVQEYGRHPVTMVSKSDAQAYCRWLSKVTGKAYGLPTQEQWEKAAHGADARKYPWGNSEPNRTLCNIEHWFGGTTPVGQFSPAGDGPKFDNPYGCADMVGNVSEWTSDTRTYTYPFHPDCDPDFYYYRTTMSIVACGTSWRMRRQDCNGHHTYGHVSDDVGFRVVAHPSVKPDSAS